MAKKIVRRLPVPPGAQSVSVIVREFPELPAVRALGLVQMGPRWIQAEHAHDEFEAHFVRHGGGTLTVRGRPFSFKTGDIYIFRPAEFHGGWTDAKDPGQVCYFKFSAPRYLQAALHQAVGSEPIFPAADSADLRAAFQALCDELAVIGSHVQTQIELKELPPSLVARALHLLGALIEPVRRPRALTGTPRERELAEAVMRAVEGSRAPKLSIAAIAGQLDVTPAYLGAALRKVTGKTFPGVVAELRVRRARQLLSDSQIPVREAARRVGLSGPRALSRLFRRVTGKTPASFRT